MAKTWARAIKSATGQIWRGGVRGQRREIKKMSFWAYKWMEGLAGRMANFAISITIFFVTEFTVMIEQVDMGRGKKICCRANLEGFFTVSVKKSEKWVLGLQWGDKSLCSASSINLLDSRFSPGYLISTFTTEYILYKLAKNCFI